MAERLTKVGNRIEIAVATSGVIRSLDDLIADAEIYQNEIDTYSAKLTKVQAQIKEARALGVTSDIEDAVAK